MQKEWLITKKRSGMSIVEVILASAVFVLLVTAFVGAYLYGQESTVLAGNRARAVSLAEEGLEAVRNIRDAGYSNLTDGTYGLTTTGNHWNLSGGSDVTEIFTRQITISSIDAKRKSVTSLVTWQQNPQRTGSVSLVTYLNNWFEAVAAPGTRIAYYDKDNTALKFASCDINCTNAANWTKIIVDNSGQVGEYTSIAMDGDKPRIAYYDSSNKSLKYAFCNAVCTVPLNWTIATADSAGHDGQYSSLALDSGKPRIAYYSKTDKDLNYAACDINCSNSANWTSVSIGTTGNEGTYTSLALDSGKPRIAYYSSTNKDFHYASCNANCMSSSNWTVTAVDTLGDVGSHASLFLDAGKPRVTYSDATNKALKYASCEANCTSITNWISVILDIDIGKNVGQFTSLVLDSGKPRVSYYDTTNKAIKYASCDSMCILPLNWTNSLVDPTPDRGNYGSLASDGGQMRVSHYDAQARNLRYSFCNANCTTASNWESTAIDSTGDVGQYSSLNR